MIKAEVIGQNLILKTNTVISDSVKYLTVKFICDEDWVGCCKTAIFRNEENDKTVSVVLAKGSSMYLEDDTCLVPYEVIKTPGFTVSLLGIDGEKIITTGEIPVNVEKSGIADGDEPSEPTPSEYQQIISIMNDTEDIAYSVRRDADNGVFNGSDGAKGEKGDKGDIGPQGPQGLPGKTQTIDAVYSAVSDNAASSKALAEVFCGALQGTASGTNISVDDVSPVTHDLSIKVSSDTLTDLTTVEVSRYGKNLLPYPYYETTKTANGVTFTVNDDGTVTASGTATANAFFLLTDRITTDRDYRLVGCPTGGSANTACLVVINFVNPNSYDTGNGVTIPSGSDVSLRIMVGKGATVNTIFKPMLLLTDCSDYTYEQYKTPRTGTAAEDGTVSGLTSLSPNMSLVSNNNGAVMNLEYNRDINIAFEKIENLISAI